MIASRALCIFVLVLAACGDGAAVGTGDAVARVGEAELTEAALAEALGDVPAGLDSATARAQVVEQWVQRQLLVQEARDQGLDRDPEVQRRLADAEQATLEAAVLDRFFTDAPPMPSADDVRAYYERHRARLALREPYVRLRHVRAASARQAAAARAALARAGASPLADSLFRTIAAEFSEDPQGAVALSQEYVPEGRLRALDEALGTQVAALSPGQIAVVPSDGVVHVVQVADRVTAGTVPPLGLIEREIEERLAIQMRKDAEVRLLQRLRSEAQARNRLEIR